LVNEIYAASEEPLEGISGQSLCDAITHPSKQFIATPDDCIGGLTRELKAGDFVVCLGAGSIGALPEKLLSALINRAK
jgi:UDP-N-acetylmuramate--alanine ligase